jgi:putative PIN family toxin of toxin-antitoxin system
MPGGMGTFEGCPPGKPLDKERGRICRKAFHYIRVSGMQQAIDPRALSSAPPIVVLDTNAVLDWLVFRDPGAAPLARALEGRRLRWLATPAMQRELEHMLVHPSLSRWQPEYERVLTIIASHVTLIEPNPPRAPHGLQCSDPDDQIFIDLAVAERARWLISHDRAVLRLARRLRVLGVEVLRPADWAARQAVSCATE